MAARKRRQTHDAMLEKVHNAFLKAYLQTTSFTYKPPTAYNSLSDPSTSLGYDQAGSTMLVGSIAFPMRNIHTRTNVPRVQIPNQFKDWRMLEKFMQALVNRGGDHFHILQCEMGHFQYDVNARFVEPQNNKKLPYINVSCKGPRMYWSFDDANSCQFTLQVKSDPGNATHNRKLILFAGKLKPNTRVDTPSTLGLPFGIVIQGEKRDEKADKDGADGGKISEYESILEIVLAPEQMTAIHMDWFVPPAINPSLFKQEDFGVGDNTVKRNVLSETSHKFPQDFVDLFFTSDALTYFQTIVGNIQIPMGSAVSDYLVYLKQGDPTLDIIQVTCNHMCDFMWKSVDINFKIQAYKNITHVMVLELFKRFTENKFAGNIPTPNATHPTPFVMKDESIENLVNIYSLYDTDPPPDAQSVTVSTKKNILFKAVSALLHQIWRSFPFSHGVSKLLSFEQEVTLLHELKKQVIYLDKVFASVFESPATHRTSAQYLELFQHIDESIAFAIKKPCEEYYALKADMQHAKHWLLNTDMGMEHLLRKEYLDPCSVWMAMFPLKIKSLTIVACLGKLRAYIPWVYNSFKFIMPYIIDMAPGRKLPLSKAQLDARTIARRKEAHQMPADATFTAYNVLTLDLHGRYIGSYGIRQQPKISSNFCTPIRIDMNRYSGGGACANKGMGENVADVVHASKLVTEVVQQSGMSRSGSVAENRGIGGHRQYSVAQGPDRNASYNLLFFPYTLNGFFHMHSMSLKSMYGEYSDTRDMFVNIWSSPNMDHVYAYTYYMIYILETSHRYSYLVNFYVTNITGILKNRPVYTAIQNELHALIHSAIIEMGVKIGDSYQFEFNDWVAKYNAFYSYHRAAIEKILKKTEMPVAIDLPADISTDSLVYTDIDADFKKFHDIGDMQKSKDDLDKFGGIGQNWKLCMLRVSEFATLNIIEAHSNPLEFKQNLCAFIRHVMDMISIDKTRIIPYFVAKYLSTIPYGRSTYERTLKSLETHDDTDGLLILSHMIRTAMQVFTQIILIEDSLYKDLLDQFRLVLKTSFFDKLYETIPVLETKLFDRTVFTRFRYNGMYIPIPDEISQNLSEDMILSTIDGRRSLEGRDVVDDTAVQLLAVRQHDGISIYRTLFDEFVKYNDLVEDDKALAKFNECHALYEDAKSTIRRQTINYDDDHLDFEPFSSKSHMVAEDITEEMSIKVVVAVQPADPMAV